MSLSFPLVIEHLRVSRCMPQLNGSGYRASCPVHDSRRLQLELSVKADGNGDAVLKCDDGCDPAQILAEIGLCMADPVGKQQAAAATQGPPQRASLKARGGESLANPVTLGARRDAVS